MKMDVIVDDVENRIRSFGLKASAPRVNIMKVLEASSGQGQHLSADDVYKELLLADRSVGLATVYRVLHDFESAGLVRRHHLKPGYCSFELMSNKRHGHMVCIDSDKVINFSDKMIEQRQRTIAKEHGYELVDYSLVLRVRRVK